MNLTAVDNELREKIPLLYFVYKLLICILIAEYSIGILAVLYASGFAVGYCGGDIPCATGHMERMASYLDSLDVVYLWDLWK